MSKYLSELSIGLIKQKSSDLISLVVTFLLLEETFDANIYNIANFVLFAKKLDEIAKTW